MTALIDGQAWHVCEDARSYIDVYGTGGILHFIAEPYFDPSDIPEDERVKNLQFGIRRDDIGDLDGFETTHNMPEHFSDFEYWTAGRAGERSFYHGVGEFTVASIDEGLIKGTFWFEVDEIEVTISDGSFLLPIDIY